MADLLNKPDWIAAKRRNRREKGCNIREELFSKCNFSSKFCDFCAFFRHLFDLFFNATAGENEIN